ncbi:MAG: single-stranded-DNA-specific exonuclease RecJ [Casimicrobiaceae bacterium]
MTTRPIVRRPAGAATAALHAAGLSPVLARIYAARGIASVGELDHSFAALPPFAAMKGIDAAARRLAAAITAQQRILIVADYDADGATACAVGMRGLAAMGAQVDFIVPNRFEYGYGLTPEIVALASQRQPHLLVTVDNGIASVEGVAAARALGIDVLITDHHLPGDTLPVDAIIVNPNQPGCTFPSKHIAGVGVMFYVLLALRARMREDGAFAAQREPNLAALLDLVALGTVADVVRLDQTNRVFVEQGLARIRGGRAQPGVNALFDVAGRDPHRATAFDLGFVAGPRLNAAGRLADMSLGIRCLLATTEADAGPLAAALDKLNRERREVESVMQHEALADLDRLVVDDPAERCTVCLFRPEWHQGVVGIVASRLKDRLHRPAIVFARGTGSELKGSGRSIPGLHLRDALDLVSKRSPGVIARFGGHAFAAGLSIEETDLPRFVASFEDVVREVLGGVPPPAHCDSDGALAPGELTFALADALRDRVWGQGLPPPVFDDEFDVVASRLVGGKHRKLVLQRAGERFEAMLFQHPGDLPGRIRAAFRPGVNEWQGQAALQLTIEHWLPV